MLPTVWEISFVWILVSWQGRGWWTIRFCLELRTRRICWKMIRSSYCPGTWRWCWFFEWMVLFIIWLLSHDDDDDDDDDDDNDDDDNNHVLHILLPCSGFDLTKQTNPTRVIEGPGLFYIGIIDYLQKYTFAKKVERFWKVYIKGLSGQDISDVPPERYRDRILQKVVGNVRTCLSFFLSPLSYYSWTVCYV